MKEVFLTCPKCGKLIVFKNWIAWVICSPFHWFGKRYTKCHMCGKKSWIGRNK